MTVTARDSASIDSQTPVSFTFDGRKYQGCKGDTLASALLANNVHLTGRSFKYHRPRGIMGAGAEEPNALVGVGTDGRIEPNLKATQVELYDGLVAVSQNRFPSLKLDVAEINSVLSRFFPAGFYYKTFMWPASFWMTYEKFIRHAAGLGKVGHEHNDPDRYEKRHAHFEIVIIGGGLSGLMAGLQAAKSGQRVLIAEDQPQWGGWLRACEDIFVDGMSGQAWAEQAVSRLQAMENVTLLSRTTCFGYGDHNFLTLAERVSDHLAEKPAHLPRQRLWKIRARQVILATGAIERPLVFAGNDLPGVMLASAAQTYLCQYGVLAGTRGILMTNNDAAWHNAFALHRAGCLVKVIVDTRRNPSPALIKQATELGIQTRLGAGIIAAHGRLHIARVEIAPLNEAGDALTGEPEHFDCDLVMMSGGMNPVVHLHSQARGKLKWDERSHCFCPSTTHEAEQSVGSCNGSFDAAIGAKEAIAAARKAIKANSGEAEEIALPEITAPKIKWTPMPVWQIPTGQPAGQGGKAFVDFQNDVTANDIQLAVREGYHSVEHVKRYTTTGMATDQGKTSNINALAILARERASDIPSVGTTTFRMPYTPTSIGMIAGRDIGGLFDPVRTTPMDKWHRAAGAKFEHVGQWMRAWYYPKDGETMQEAVTREVEAARQYAGLLDASTLGKIDIRGRDAAEFLNRIYTNSWLKLGIGKCRYGLMCKDDGMVMDDGVTTRLAEDHFHMTTTTGGAAGVLDWLEEWLQTEWPDLQVYLTSVTEQWAVATLSGPAARDILKAAGTDIDLGDEDFGFMSMREGHISGLPARIYRISFTGELSYEINVPARYGMALWTSLMRAGRDFGITPYGTEAMHLLRAEKGFIIVGQETDGTVTPYDLGMNWIVSDKKPDFIGKRALARQSMGLGDRKQLVGLRTKDPKQVIPEGAHAVLDPNQPPPVDMLGHVTSSYFSPTLGHSIAMALLRGGHARKGQTVYFPMLDGSAPIEATITDTNFYDPKGERLNG
ncbi:MAG: sarcosine oxidase subunit alpha family protein [Candidatus Puniceispirillaceae bacterium]